MKRVIFGFFVLFFVALTLIGVDLENQNVVAVLIAALVILLACFGWQSLRMAQLTAPANSMLPQDHAFSHASHPQKPRAPAKAIFLVDATRCE